MSDQRLREAERLRNEDPEAYARELVRSGEAFRALEILQASLHYLDEAATWPLLNVAHQRQSRLGLVGHTLDDGAAVLRPGTRKGFPLSLPMLGDPIPRTRLFSCWSLNTSAGTEAERANVLMTLVDSARDRFLLNNVSLATLRSQHYFPHRFEQASYLRVELENTSDHVIVVNVTIFGGWIDL